MITTQELINLLINDNQTELEKFFKPNWYKDINFKDVYETIKNNNNSSCQNMIGYMYGNGKGVEKDHEKAFHWYQLAAKQDNSTAQFNLGTMHIFGLKDYEKAFYWYQMAADKDQIDAQFNLGRMYETGQGVEQDYQKALHWYQKSAYQGQYSAQFNIGHMYETGLGVQQDYEKALHWYQLSADQGLSNAQNNIGHFYQNGMGVEQDYQKALNWYQLAADQGLVLAQNNIKKLLNTWIDKGLDKYIQNLETKCQKLEEENNDLKYRPGGIGFEECKDRFDKQDY